MFLDSCKGAFQLLPGLTHLDSLILDVQCEYDNYTLSPESAKALFLVLDDKLPQVSTVQLGDLNLSAFTAIDRSLEVPLSSTVAPFIKKSSMQLDCRIVLRSDRT
jgi:hypothetical protein